MQYVKLILVSLATGFGLGFGFWCAHLLLKKIFGLKIEKEEDI